MLSTISAKVFLPRLRGLSTRTRCTGIDRTVAACGAATRGGSAGGAAAPATSPAIGSGCLAQVHPLGHAEQVVEAREAVGIEADAVVIGQATAMAIAGSR